MKKENKKDLKFIYKTASKLFNALFYIAIAVVALSVMIALIVLIVNVPTEEMLLPPYMKKLLDDGGNIVEYSIDLGNGATITKQATEVTLGNIKNVIYCFLLMMGISSVVKYSLSTISWYAVWMVEAMLAACICHTMVVSGSAEKNGTRSPSPDSFCEMGVMM